MAGALSVLERELDRILADPLRATPGATRGPTLGYVGADLPLDLLLATGRPCCHLPWVADRATPLAQQWLESSFPGWACSILEDWALGRFDTIGQVIFSRGEDAAQRLYYYVCELQRRGQLAGPEPLIFDIARIPRASSQRHTGAAVRHLAAQLAVSDAALVAGIRQANRRRAQWADINADRSSHGPIYEKIGRASLFADLDRLLETAGLPAGIARRRVLLAGSAPPDDRLHRAVEEADWSIIAEAHPLAPARLGPAISEYEPDPAVAIALQRHAMPYGPRGFGDAAEGLLAAAGRSRADAVLLWLTREDEALAWHVPAQRARLAAAGIPALVMPARRWDASDGAADEIRGWLGSLHR
ncbi:MAG: 2-hydroxyacyl-CoA dehydratase [Gammaproteobacteria bacterium]|nr:2-hydroxyacyl-CoA dehydratase [Gammaproteobacteria bacterium]